MFNGIFGHKTIKKYITVDGMYPKAPESYGTFLCYGPLCRYAKDLPLALRAMGGSLTDELRLDEPVDFKQIKIYYTEHDGGNPLTSFVDQRILNSMHQVMRYFREEYGMETEQININKFKHSLGEFAKIAFFRCHRLLIDKFCSHILAYFGTTCCAKGGVRIEDYVSRTGHLNVFWEIFKSLFGKSDITRPILVQILNQSSSYCDSQSKSYRRFTQMLQELKPKVHDMLGDNAVLIMPTW